MLASPWWGTGLVTWVISFPMIQIILTRHCQTELLASGDPGAKRNDSSLSTLGLRQAKEIAEFIKKYDYEAMFTSLFIRSIKTGEIINEGRKVPIFSNISLSEYFLGDDGKGRESVDMGINRTMSYLYNFFGIFNSIAIVGHKSINSTILRSILNMDFEEAESYFKSPGETLLLRRDWKSGDKTWHVVAKFIPNQE